jgi:hypothetical protein
MVTITVHTARWFWLLILWRLFTFGQTENYTQQQRQTRPYETFIITIVCYFLFIFWRFHPRSGTTRTDCISFDHLGFDLHELITFNNFRYIYGAFNFQPFCWDWRWKDYFVCFVLFFLLSVCPPHRAHTISSWSPLVK